MTTAADIHTIIGCIERFEASVKENTVAVNQLVAILKKVPGENIENEVDQDMLKMICHHKFGIGGNKILAAGLLAFLLPSSCTNVYSHFQ